MTEAEELKAFAEREAQWARGQGFRSYARWLTDEAPSKTLRELADAASHRARYYRYVSLRKESARDDGARFWKRLEKHKFADSTLAEMNDLREMFGQPRVSAEDCTSGKVPMRELRRCFRVAAQDSVRAQSGASPRVLKESYRRVNEIISKVENG